MFVSTRRAVERLGLHPNTLRKYADNGTINTIKTCGGRRLYDVDAFLGDHPEAKTICYCRVSSSKQKDDLARQSARMRQAYPEAEIVGDIGSGLNYKRPGFRAILERLVRGEKLCIVVANRDRLARFGFQLIEFLASVKGGSVLVLDPGIGSAPNAELAEDLLAILHHFSCRMHGQRSRKNKTNPGLPDGKTA